MNISYLSSYFGTSENIGKYKTKNFQWVIAVIRCFGQVPAICNSSILPKSLDLAYH